VDNIGFTQCASGKLFSAKRLPQKPGLKCQQQSRQPTTQDWPTPHGCSRVQLKEGKQNSAGLDPIWQRNAKETKSEQCLSGTVGPVMLTVPIPQGITISRGRSGPSLGYVCSHPTLKH